MTFIPYTITYYDEDINTWFTDRPSVVRRWISSIKYIHRYRLRKLVVGLDIEWCPPHLSRDTQSPVATLQLCVGHRCLIFQILHADYIPSSLVRFLENVMYTFVGVGIQEDARKLCKDYGLRVSRMVDLRGLAVARLGEGSWAKAGLKRLCARVLGKELEKVKSISYSRWDSVDLSEEQIVYACLDAFVSFELGRVLRADSFGDLKGSHRG